MSSVPDSVQRSTALPLPLPLHVDGVDVHSETLLTDAGYTLVLQTTIPHPSAPVDVHSAYVGLPGAPTRITHAIVGAGPDMTEQRTTSGQYMPVLAARRRCLQDHLQRVYDVLIDLGRVPSIDAAALDHAFSVADGS
jgi:hypothetical protein